MIPLTVTMQILPIFVGLQLPEDNASKADRLSPPNNRAAAFSLRKQGLKEAAKRAKHLGIKEAVYYMLQAR